MRHLAQHFPAPVSGKSVGSAGIYSIDWYIYMFVLEDGIDEVAAAADAGYIGSKKDSYNLSKGNTMESSRLHQRKRVLACDPFMKLKWGCLLTPRNFEREAATTPLGSSNKIKPKWLDVVAAKTRQTRKPFN